ncbi:MAG: ABC transporter substrate-binding protein [Atopobiaceae bacterium]|nr:ABC transporter substrate-binding protein [Atopobiaceae bacterium]MCI1389795.1 ABC transporter substrate-binding protein [Atopobiaceae bacterium]MCI1432169.1 ABC transporter substrate-binding protein [Atopobiaceae bacterium]MCI1470627.1 ABC transporter substrate-binding protein [Atopobiaceae bacterium]
MSRRAFIKGTLTSAAILSLAACGSTGGSSTGSDAGGSSDSSASTGGSINVGLNSAPVSENIWYQNDLNSATIMGLVCPNTVAMDDSGSKYNYLVESADPNDDATVWTVKLKDGLKWNDGEAVTSDDLMFTGKYGTDNHIGFFDSYYNNVDWDATQTLDDQTVEFHLSSANVNFWNGAGYWIPIMRKSEWESVTDPSTYSYSGAGYGPYYVAEWVDGEYVTLKRNDYYTLANDGDGAYVDEIVFRVYTDENAMVLALQNGEVDAAADFITQNSASQLESDEQFQIDSVDSLGYALCTFSQKVPLLTDYNVRKAFAMCCDRDAICSVAWAGSATPMYTPISPVYEEFTKSDIEQPAFDTDGAAELLEKAGYTDSDGDGIREDANGNKLEFKLTYKSTLSNVDGVMSILTSDLEKAGFKIDLEPVDAATFSANVTQGHNYEISYSSWGVIDDVDTTLLTCFGEGQTLNFMDYNDDEEEALLQQMQGETDKKKRIELLDEWQQWFVDHLPCVHLFVPSNIYAASNANFSGWSLVYGNGGYMTCSTFEKVHKN